MVVSPASAALTAVRILPAAVLPGSIITGVSHPMKARTHADGQGGTNPLPVEYPAKSMMQNAPMPEIPLIVEKRSGMPICLATWLTRMPLIPQLRLSWFDVSETIMSSSRTNLFAPPLFTHIPALPVESVSKPRVVSIVAK